jgi:hypothetical protein
MKTTNNQSLTALTVERITGITVAEQIAHKTNMGILYLQDRLSLNQEEAIELADSTLFWLWWDNLWARTDRQAITHLAPASGRYTKWWVKKQWLHIHHPDNIRFYPHSIILKSKSKSK